MVESSEIVRGIGLVLVAGVGLQWIARRLHVPSIILLLAGGLAVGPGLGWLDPDEVFGDTLFPVVSLAVGVLLFNGGMELRFADLRPAADGRPRGPRGRRRPHARGGRDLEGRDDLPFTVHTGLIRDLPRDGRLADVGGAIIASRDDAVDLVALDLSIGRFGRRRVWVLPSEPSDGSADGPDLEVWAPRPFSAGVTHDRLDEAIAAGHAVRTVEAHALGGHPGGDDGASPMVLAALTPDGRWTATVDGPHPPGTRLVVLSVQRELEGDQHEADHAAGEG